MKVLSMVDTLTLKRLFRNELSLKTNVKVPPLISSRNRTSNYSPASWICAFGEQNKQKLEGENKEK
jgi:hypothetical protein